MTKGIAKPVEPPDDRWQIVERSGVAIVDSTDFAGKYQEELPKWLEDKSLRICNSFGSIVIEFASALDSDGARFEAYRLARRQAEGIEGCNLINFVQADRSWTHKRDSEGTEIERFYFYVDLYQVKPTDV